MFKSTVTAVFVAAGLLAEPVLAQSSGAVVTKSPGVARAVRTETANATITSIDAKSRVITLKSPQGKEFAAEVGPEVKNFDQLKVGDQVDVQYIEALLVQLKKGGGAPVTSSAQGGAVTAKKGEAPGAAVGRQVTVVGDVIDLDPAKRMVTVRGPKRTVAFDVEDPEQFKLIAKGDQIEATYTEALAVSVTPTAKKK